MGAGLLGFGSGRPTVASFVGALPVGVHAPVELELLIELGDEFLARARPLGAQLADAAIDCCRLLPSH
jgi:hypothetical protein